MSGVKSLEVRPSVAERKAMRRASMRRAHEERQAAERELDAARSALARELDDSAREGIAAPAARAALVRAREATGGISTDEVRARAAEAIRARDLTARAAALVSGLPAQAAARRALVARLGRAEDIAALDACLSEWLAAQRDLGALEGCLRRAERGMNLLASCDVAGVPLDSEIASARREVASFLKNPRTARIPAVQGALGLIEGSHLHAALEARRARLVRALDAAAEPTLAAEIEAFRPGLPKALRELGERTAREGFVAADRPLAELDAFLRARAEARVVLQSGEAAGLRATSVTFDPARRAFVAELSDEHGPFAHVAESVADWTALGADDMIEMVGPGEWDGPACVHGGYGEILQALRAQGVPARLFGEDGQELCPAPERPEAIELAEPVALAPGRAARGMS
jgi:hypothetical protein